MKGLAELRKLSAPEKILGIDASSKSLAFGIVDKGSLTNYGIIRFDKGDLTARKRACSRLMKATGSWPNVDLVVMEDATVGVNARVGLTLSKFYGIIQGQLLEYHDEIKEVHAITWQSYIGMKRLTTKSMKESHPGQKAAWYTTERRVASKQFTIDWVNNKFGTSITDDNIADAVAISCWGWSEYGRL